MYEGGDKYGGVVRGVEGCGGGWSGSVRVLQGCEGCNRSLEW